MVRRLLRPTATIAHRRNARASAQAGMFTVHGGKVYNHRELVADRHSALPRPIEFPFDAAEDEIGLLAAVRELERASCCEILRDFVVPAGKKKDIREELLAAGISAATLFPDPEGYARYLGDMWRDQAIAFPRANGDHGR